MGEKVPDDFQVREALQVLRDPHQRLVAELFWFHDDGEDMPDSANALAFQKLRLGDWQSARDGWKSEWNRDRQSESGRRALHNLAVLEHARVMTIEVGARPLYKQMRAGTMLEGAHLQSWATALGAWNAYLQDKGAWNFWRTRVVELGDRRLAPAFVEELRTLLPETLLLINRDLARRYAEHGLGLAAGQHCALMRKSGFDGEQALALCRTVLDPIKGRLKTECDEFQNTLSSDNVENLAAKFEGRVRPDLQLLAQIDQKREYGASAAREGVARSFHRAGIAHAQGRAWMAALATLNKAVSLADSLTLKSDIRDTVSQVEFNRDIWRLAPTTCLCCRLAPTDWNVLTRSNSGDRRLIFTCDRHAEDGREEEVYAAADRSWYSLPQPPRERDI